MRRVALLSFLLLAACARRPSSAPIDGGEAAETAGGDAGPKSGAALYASMCSVCHGPEGKGYRADNAPSLVTSTFLESATDEQLRRSIVDGRPGTSMAGYGKERGGPLGPEEIAQIVAWIRSRGPAAKTLPPRKKGDVSRGASLYASNCEKCHGTAVTRGNAVHLANARFLEAAPDAFLGWAIEQGRPGTAMEAWKGRLTDAQIDDLVAYVRSLAAPPPPASLPAPTGKEPIVINPTGKQATFKPRSSPCVPNTPCVPDEMFVSVDQVKQALAEKRRIVIIDARPASDWMRVHIPDAVSIPYHEPARLAEVPNDGTWVIAYCACPHHLSGVVVNELRKRGVKHAAILDEGILEWHRRGYPVVAAPGVEPPPKAPPLTP